MNPKIHVTVWGENVHEKKIAAVAKIYPKRHARSHRRGLRESADFEVRTATLDQPEHGLTEEILDQTDVLTWWGHCAHGDVDDKIVDRVQKRVLQGMGLIVLHSGHYSKIFKRLLGTTCSLTWREAGEKERLWVCNPGHPIAQGIDRYFEIPQRGNVRRALRHPDSGRDYLHQLVPGRRSLPLRLHLETRQRQNLLFPPRPRDLSHLPPEGSPPRHPNAVLWARPEGSRWIDTARTSRSRKPPKKSCFKANPSTNRAKPDFANSCGGR